MTTRHPITAGVGAMQVTAPQDRGWAPGLALLAVLAILASCTRPPDPPLDSGIPLDPRIEEIRTLLRDGHFDEGHEQAQGLIAEARAAHGPASLPVARALDLLAEYYWRSQQAQDPRALESAEQAAQMKRDLGASKAEIATSLRNVAKLMDGRGEAARAAELFETIVKLKQQVFGDDTSEAALASFDLAQMYQTTGQLAQARSAYEQVLAIQRRLPDDPWITYTLNNLAMVHHELAEYDEARSMYEQALALKEREAQDCTGEMNVTWTLNALAVLLVEMGEYDEAASLYERALSIRRECLGDDHPWAALILVNLAQLARLRGDYVESKRHYEQALRIEVESYGREHVEVIETQYNLARLCFDMGDYSESKRLYAEAVSFWENSPRPDAKWMGAALQGVASTLTELGEHTRARELQEQALSMLETSSGKRHVAYAFSLERLAVLLERTDEPAAAIDLHQQALEIRQDALGTEHPELVAGLRTLAGLHLRNGAADEALLLLDRALAISAFSLGETHPEAARIQGQRGQALAATGNTRAALETSLRAEEIGREHLRLTLRYLSEREALHFASIRSSGLDVALSLAAAGLDVTSVREVWDSLSRSRALVLDEMAARNRAMRDPEVASLAHELGVRSRRLANLWIRGLDTLDPDRYRSLLDSATRAVEQAQRALAEKSEAFRQDHGRESPALETIIDGLPQRTALVAFALYDRLASGSEGSVPSYMAFVLPGAGADPLVVPLGPAAEVDRLVERWTEEAGREALAASAEEAYREAGAALRRTVWDAVASTLRDRERIFVVPAGALNLVSLAALPASSSTYLVESGPRIHYLSAERDLVLAATPRAGGEGLLAVGGPDFDLDARAGASGPAQGSIRRGIGCEGFRDVVFEPLPATLGETEEIIRLWDETNQSSQSLTRAGASESAFKDQAPGRRVLHIATHGFFLGGACSSARSRTRGIDLRPQAAEDVSPIAIENPLLLSGLALAGANRREQAPLDEDDGILTAAEIAAMDLSGVEWAVLSACDTGVGELQAGEGVLGLRRSFQIAGARTTIMSLWAVDDELAREWMVELYRGRLSEGLATDEAVHRATLRLLQQARGRGTSHPYYWAGFVAAGDWH